MVFKDQILVGAIIMIKNLHKQEKLKRYQLLKYLGSIKTQII